jgi:hypothetical protein
VPKLKLKYLGVDFEVRDYTKTYFVFGLRKSGSTFLNEAVLYLSQRNDENWVSIPDRLFQHNIDFEGHYARYIPKGLIKPGNVYGGFRVFPDCLTPNGYFRSGLKILMVRDPRDALVSQYYSITSNHALPVGPDVGLRQDLLSLRNSVSRLEIDDYVIREAPSFVSAMLSYRSILSDEHTCVLKYEDMIFNKSSMLKIICDHFSWKISDNDASDILHHIDKFPQEEDEFAFLRRVTPGDHKIKLRSDTIACLNSTLKEVMDLYGYVADAPLSRQTDVERFVDASNKDYR